MNLLVLGASGGCGSWIAQFAVERDHQVRVIVRPETQYQTPAGVEAIRGNVLDLHVLKVAISGCDVVISALGIKRKNPRNPWSDLASPKDLTERVANMLVELMPTEKIERFIGISAAGARESIQSTSPVIRWMISNSSIRYQYGDLAKMESTFEKTALDWLTVRPVTLTNIVQSGKVKLTNYYGLTNCISRRDVAAWILDAIEQPVPFSNRTPMISSN